MKLEQALPILKEFGYYLDEKNKVFLVKYNYRNRYICQMLFVDVVKSLESQQQLRDTVLMIYNNCIKKLKSKYSWIDKSKVLPVNILENDPADWWKNANN